MFQKGGLEGLAPYLRERRQTTPSNKRKVKCSLLKKGQFKRACLLVCLSPSLKIRRRESAGLSRDAALISPLGLKSNCVQTLRRKSNRNPPPTPPLPPTTKPNHPCETDKYKTSCVRGKQGGTHCAGLSLCRRRRRRRRSSEDRVLEVGSRRRNENTGGS